MTEIYYSLRHLKDILRKEKPSKVLVVSSTALKKKLDWALHDIFNMHKGVEEVFIPDGEKAKEWKIIELLLKKFIHLGLDRNSIVIVLGGGSIGDSVGFAASIYLRGIKYINIPTTLLSQVDSAHGGKTAINFSKYKNQIGTFRNPTAIIIDERFIKTLPQDQIIDGLGEIIKAGFIKDKNIITLLESQTVASLAKSKVLKEIIKRALQVKNYFIQQDYKDQGIRQILNVGHTVGHALELKYKLSHGRAVLLGMMQESDINVNLGLTKKDIKTELIKLLETMGITLKENVTPEWKTILHDKKIRGSEIMWPYIAEKGKADLEKTKLSNVKKALEASLH